MSGKPKFDEDAVIAAAMNIFWLHGYAAASISDLTEATGLSRSSLYQRFGDKDGLFQEALANYTRRVLRRMNAVQGDSARERIEAMLRAFLPNAAAPPRPAGCLIARSCAEMVDLSAAGQAAAMAAAKSQREIVVGLLREGVAKGELARDADIEALAWYYLGILQAVLNFRYTGADADMLARMIDVAMSAWPACAGQGGPP